ncbi:MAG: isoprenylcysteine carboxylmethyltransferase family protein, partial [Candidatus Acidiferrales bacterium]
GIYWLVGALKTRSTVSQESAASRYGIFALEFLGYVLIFSNLVGRGVLGHLVVHRNYALEITGVAFTWIGIAIALWARWYLGQYWSARITLKENHKLIRSGPHAHFRHPILLRPRSRGDRRSFGG